MTLNVWEKIEDVANKIEFFTKVIQGPKETFMHFLQRLISAVNTMIPISEARQIVIESLGFEKTNSQCKWIIKSLKVRSEPLKEWI